MATDDKQRKLAPISRKEAKAGAGTLGFFGFLVLTALALMFFIAEGFFLSMLLMSFALLFYVAGAELIGLMKATVQVFFVTTHVDPKAAQVQQTVAALRHQLHMKRDDQGNIKAGVIEKGHKIKLPDNELVRDVQAVLRGEKGEGKGSQYAEYVAHEYYVDCRALYDHFHTHLEFVAGVMPLLGLIGTVVGLIGMFDKLGPNTSVETLAPELAISLQTTLYGAVLASAYTILASRFDQRIKALEYDYDILGHAIDVMVKNEVLIEVEK